MIDPMISVTCCNCGCLFGMAQSLNSWFRADADRWFYCPRGHKQHYSNENNDLEKLRLERNRLKQGQAQLYDQIRDEQLGREAAERRARAMKGVATRMKNRVKRGVCPCCNRTFADLARHMAGQHPDFDNVVVLAEKEAANG